ncbi:NAD-dependent epimerase/dehydratase family protein [Candidatus Margulisiibacteriota bacterium]
MSKKMNCLVTGCAGFIGSSLSEKLIELGYSVTGIDCFTDYYPRKLKEQNISRLRRERNFVFHEEDLLTTDLDKLLAGKEIVFHEAAQAGVRTSWGASFEIYTRSNILLTQKLLEAARKQPIKKFIFASSSSVYGDTRDLPMREESTVSPVSPYGVSKLAAEQLCRLYYKNYKVPTIMLRYFTVYGPRQRPDMAFHIFTKALVEDQEIVIYGDGKQTRDFTYISDIVDGNLAAMNSDSLGEVFNLGGGSRVTLMQTIQMLEEIMNKKARLKFVAKSHGDMRDTSADISKSQRLLDYQPKVSLKEGLAKEVAWFKSL